MQTPRWGGDNKRKVLLTLRALLRTVLLKAGKHFEPGLLSLFSRLLQTANINFTHLKHGLHHPFRFLGIWLIFSNSPSAGRDDLPGNPKFIFQPPAFTFFSTSGKLFP